MPPAYEENGDMLKLCITCAEVKGVAEFSTSKKAPDGLNSSCRKCKSDYSKIWQQSNRERRTAAKREWCKANRERATEYARKSRLKCKYGMTVAEYEGLHEFQNGLCGCCFDLLGTRTETDIDHDHSYPENEGKGKKEAVRGLCCRDCNQTAIGNYENGRRSASWVPLLEVKAYLANPPAWQLWGVPDYIKERELAALAA